MSDPQTNPPTGSTPPPPSPPPPANPASSSSDSDAERRKAELLAALERDEASARAGASSSSPPSSSTPSPTPPLEDPPAKPEGLETSPTVAGAEQVQQRVDEENARGFIGTKVEPLPNSAFTLESGPDAPANVPDAQTRVTQHALDATVRPPSSSSSSS